jgi:hypothetical protein
MEGGKQKGLKKALFCGGGQAKVIPVFMRGS